MQRVLRTLFLIWGLLLISVNSLALKVENSEGDPVLLDADQANIEYDDDGNQVILLRGNVQVIHQQQHMTASEATIHTKTRMIDAVGNVMLVTPKATLSAKRVLLSYETNTGEAYDGFIQSGQVTFAGTLIRKTGDNTYEAEDSDYTSCTTCPPGWSFTGTSMNAELEGYAHIRNPIMWAGKVPIFWLPYIILPMNSNRRTGLLFPVPEFTGASGFAISESLFIVLGRSHDATVSVKHYFGGATGIGTGRRGTKFLGQYRYALAPRSRGQIDTAYLDDRILLKDRKTKRWFTRYDHSYVFPDGTENRASLNLVSDVQYPRDFVAEIETLGGQVLGNPALENRFSVFKNTESSHYSVDAAHHYNLLTTGPFSDNRDAVHRMPEFRYNLAPQRSASGFLTQFDILYNNFSRDSSSYDDRSYTDATAGNSCAALGGVPVPDGQVCVDQFGNPLRDGRFDPTRDLIRTGQRIIISPSVSYPVKVGQIEVLPSVSYTESQYRLGTGEGPREGFQESTERRYFRTQMSARTRASRFFGLENADADADKYRHEIQPEVRYTTIPWSSRADHPFFGDRDVEPSFRADSPLTSRDVIQFDYNDRLIDKNLVTFSFTNRLVRKRQYGDGNRYKQIALVRLAQSYDINEAGRSTYNSEDERQPWTDLSALVDLRFDNLELNSIMRYYPYQRTTSNSSRARIMNANGDFFQTSYTHAFSIARLPKTQVVSRSEDLNFDVFKRFKYFGMGFGNQYSLSQARSLAYTARLELTPPGNCWGFDFQYTKPINAEFSFVFNFYFMFDGKTRTGVGNSGIPQS
ncbi:MAG: hypothetical protein COT74_13110 [Bdellovibrionales bacterium CG10_big_fil_rev_8_21_14_0_10_45_34]|nr:MAG: hypothetical protein COT74_13110 [Bdellovibrionales bacterium CG10_big_fil_rev_8_21_14_0_10_45_34]